MWAYLLASLALAQEPAAPVRVRFTTTEGDFVVAVHPEWAPLGAQRFLELCTSHAWDGASFFRVIDGFVAQWGIPADPAVAKSWRDRKLKDDPRVVSNAEWTLSFANSGPNTRTDQVFVNLRDNRSLDGHGFSPFAEVVEGKEVIAKLYSGYGEGAPMGRGPDQQKIQQLGAAYLSERFPKLDAITAVTVEGAPTPPAAPPTTPPAPATPAP